VGGGVFEQRKGTGLPDPVQFKSVHTSGIEEPTLDGKGSRIEFYQVSHGDGD